MTSLSLGFPYLQQYHYHYHKHALQTNQEMISRTHHFCCLFLLNFNALVQLAVLLGIFLGTQKISCPRSYILPKSVGIMREKVEFLVFHLPFVEAVGPQLVRSTTGQRLSKLFPSIPHWWHDSPHVLRKGTFLGSELFTHSFFIRYLEYSEAYLLPFEFTDGWIDRLRSIQCHSEGERNSNRAPFNDYISKFFYCCCSHSTQET